VTDSLVYKLFHDFECREARRAGIFAGSADDRRDGFIHLSSARQVRATFAKYFSNDAAPVLASFRAVDLAPALKWEISRNGELFPHLYGALDMALAVALFPISRDAGSAAIFPPEIPQIA
jgi:uncharacterized protein (DUF952 family)